MKRRKRLKVLWPAVGLLLALLLAACGSQRSQPAQSSPMQPGDSGLSVATAAGVGNSSQVFAAGELAPDFAMKYADGQISRLSDWRGRPVIINFWATWCAPCRTEMPEFVEAYHEYREAGLVILGVNAQESAEKVHSFMEEFQMEFPVTLDSRGEIQRLYQVRGLPTTIFIDREGRVAGQWAGLLTKKALQDFLSDIL